MNIRALQAELATIEANQHNLADPQVAINAKQREILNALVDQVEALNAAVGLERVQQVDEPESTAAPALQGAPSTEPAAAPESTPSSTATADSEVQAVPVVSQDPAAPTA